MLGKLIKYDLKYGVKIFVTLHAALLISCILGRIMLIDPIDFSASTGSLLSTLTLLIVLFTVIFCAVSFGTMAIFTIRFYKNLFTDEGYLTWVLPATPMQQLWSKILSAAILYTLDIIISTLGFWILISGQNVQEIYAKFTPEFEAVFGMPVSGFFWIILLISFLTLWSTILIIYTSIAIGQLLPGHRILCSIVTYFILYTIIQMLNLGVMIITGLFPNYVSSAEQSASVMADYLINTLVITSVITTIIAIIGYFITYHIMKRKINLL